MKHVKQKYCRGDVYFAAFPNADGSENYGTHPIVIVQNNVGNYHSTTVIGVVLTSSHKKPNMPTHVILEEPGQLCDGSMAMTEQIFTLDKNRLHGYLGRLSTASMDRIDEALKLSLSLNDTETTLMCLCPRCLQAFRDLPNHFARRVNHNQQVKDTCTFCGYRMGFDYWVTRQK